MKPHRAWELRNPTNVTSSWAIHGGWDFQVLLFAHDRELAGSLRAFLEDYSCTTTLASSGPDGVKNLLWSEFDFVICDLSIPQLPYEALYTAVVRVQPHLRGRFIFLSCPEVSRDLDTFTRRIRALTLWKPFEMYEVFSAMRTVLRRAPRKPTRRDLVQLPLGTGSEFESAPGPLASMSPTADGRRVWQ
jgi:DNA-binding response OmpR family regulator